MGRALDMIGEPDHGFNRDPFDEGTLGGDTVAPRRQLTDEKARSMGSLLTRNYTEIREAIALRDAGVGGENA